ncbi:hypothetical protein Lfu02_25240 [Longispora fulva]|uniref:Drug/metabolite transporter (DMT)-like permease n=1 Tax=Longispora fulva TaxID=619741 RepID=A0A8J7GKR2_9ACTN|nr:hypothetical protein [Longispora fulva]MBG6139465.1 drug/metabolite transporter (DMT)-like permease [Longispora fulva]GIG58152.1 hypothetical protein Lfu02_25240 [Longispora fulva]
MTDLWPDEKKSRYPGQATALGLAMLLLCPTTGWVLYILDSRDQLHGAINGITIFTCFVPFQFFGTAALLSAFFKLGKRKAWPGWLALAVGLGVVLLISGVLALIASLINTD